MHLMWKAFFLKVASYKKYRNTHRVKKTYQCNYCDKAFTQKIELTEVTEHVRMHTGEKPYQCNQCDKGFYKS